MWITGGFKRGPPQFEQGPPLMDTRMGDMGGMEIMCNNAYHSYGGFEDNMMGLMGP